MRNFIKILAILSLLLATGCAAIGTSISKRNLEVQTKMSDTIFLDPVAPRNRKVLVQVRNTSDKADFNISEEIKKNIRANGYQIVEDPDKAHYILQANILQVGKVEDINPEQSGMGKYGEALAIGVGAGYAANRASAGSAGTAVAGALIGAGVSFIANSLVSDVYYLVVTDIQISEKTKTTVFAKSKHRLKQGSSGGTKTTFDETTNRKKYQTRVISFANKSNLEWEEAAPKLKEGLSQSISGLF